jgi:hypothetical protein
MRPKRIVRSLYARLIDAGYSFHFTADSTGSGRWHFCWSNGKCDVEAGEYHNNTSDAVHEAMGHWFSNARIPMEDEVA